MSFPEINPSEIFSDDIIGMDVVTADHIFIGELTDVLHTPAHDVYVIDCNGKEVLIPAVTEFVKEIDFDEDRIIISPIEGLLH
ncbi:MAG: 16S rRNA processing protein RimM [Candidatus Marinimicrobia bacterium]|nr:16S rRNA processing protein RimM [Candidatus Neomarinimicrobiota bacterium]